jgi:hypothetical protein
MEKQTSIALPPELRRRVEEYRDQNGLEKTAIAARRLIKIGLEQEMKKA